MAPELADVFRRFGPDYLARHGGNMPPSHARAIPDIIRCRTPAMGGHLYHCPDCGEDVYVQHGCRSRHCPACHADQTRKWLEARQAEALPCGYFHVTCTIPEEMREIFRSNQKDCHGLLMRVAAETAITLFRDEKYLNATPAVLAVLHTWTGRMDYHPHVHMLVSAGGVSGATGNSGVTRSRDSSSRIVAMDGESVTFRHKDRQRNLWRTIRVPGEEFMRRFLQHTLPRGFHKVHYYGLWHPANRKQAGRTRLLLMVPGNNQAQTGQAEREDGTPRHSFTQCPHCGGQRLEWVRELPRPKNRSP